MQYAVLGKTGLKVSRLGFGAMRLPMKGNSVDRDKAIPMFHRAFERGVTYVDTAVGYGRGDSQRALGEALVGWRDKMVVSTKNPHYNKRDEKTWWKNLEDSLRYLRVECIDVYNFHGLNRERYEEHVAGRDGEIGWMNKARDQGLIKHIAFSFHDTHEVLKRIAETGEFDVVTLQYNLLDRSNEPAFAAVRKAGLGIVVMGPVGGGRLGAPSEAIRKIIPGARSVPEVALRFVLSNPHVTVALSGMSEMAHVEENVRVASKAAPLSAAEKRHVEATLKRYQKLADLYCTGCKYCMPCPHGVDIASNFMLLNYVRVYALPVAARERYRWLRGKANLCVACGQCMDKCPQHIDIIQQLQETVRTLDDAYGKLLVTVTPKKVERLRRTNGRFHATIRCRLECQNLSDNDVTPHLRFSPARNLRVQLARDVGTLGPFQRRAATMRLTAAGAKDGTAWALGAAADKGVPMVFSADPLRLAIAARGSRRSPAEAMSRTPKVRAESVGHDDNPSATARAANSLTARFAYNDEALLVQMDARADFAAAAKAGRRAGQVWLALGPDAPAADMYRSGTYLNFNISGDVSKPVPVQSRRRRGSRLAGLVRCELSGGAKRRRLRVRIPWKAFKAGRPRPGKTFRTDFGITCPARRGTFQLRWSEDRGGRSYLILA